MMKKPLRSYVVFLFVSMVFAQTSAQSIWDQMQTGAEHISVDEISAFDNLDISSSAKIDLLTLCENSMTESKTIDPHKLRNHGLQSDWISSPWQEIKQDCSGRVGASFCMRHKRIEYLNECATAHITKARLMKNL
jgi:hypothetical protein